MRLPCWRCLGSGELVRRGARIPRQSLSSRQVAEELVEGGGHYRRITVTCPSCKGSGRWRRNRMTNQSFTALATDVDLALQDLRDAKQTVVEAEADLAHARGQEAAAQHALDSARDALFEAHPELRPPTAQADIGGERVAGSTMIGGEDGDPDAPPPHPDDRVSDPAEPRVGGFAKRTQP